MKNISGKILSQCDAIVSACAVLKKGCLSLNNMETVANDDYDLAPHLMAYKTNKSSYSYEVSSSESEIKCRQVMCP